MFSRKINILKTNSFFLFGARGTGKTTLLREIFSSVPTINLDLLEPDTFLRLSKKPQLLAEKLEAADPQIKWVVIDEVQKVPALLDLVHKQLETPGNRFQFALTGSSARKLKRSSANLLAGRAFVHRLFPLTHLEIGEQFSLEHALTWGTLPMTLRFKTPEEKYSYLMAYTQTYLKEEILSEQVVRHLEPFHRFLEVAAQMSGHIVNASKLGAEVGTSSKTIESYFQILEDTLVGHTLPAFDRSIRKQQMKSPKFYFFDCGVQRALADLLTVPISERTSTYGELFETFFIQELIRLNAYSLRNFRLSYLLTKDGAEIDLVVSRPGKPEALVEIKSKVEVGERDLRSLNHFRKDFPNADLICASRDPHNRVTEGIHCLHWKDALRFLEPDSPTFERQ